MAPWKIYLGFLAVLFRAGMESWMGSTALGTPEGNKGPLGTCIAYVGTHFWLKKEKVKKFVKVANERIIVGMRLKELAVSNYRSIKETSVSFSDLGIATFIGANGSGKSNLLKAIMVLAEDSTSPSDKDFHAKHTSKNGDPIEIIATFTIEERDKALLDAAGLKTFKIPAFKAVVRKEKGESATLTFEPVGYADKRPENIARLQKEMVQMVKGLAVAEALEPQKQECIESLGRDISGDNEPDDVAAYITSLTAVFEPLKASNATVADKLAKALVDLKAWLNFDINARIGTLFEGLSIELLQLSAYQIENSAPMTELQTRDAHPFLYDLLVLAEKKADDFLPTDTPDLLGVRKDASDQLSRAISDVWLSHNLRFEIDKQAEKLVFVVLTPQGRPVSITDLSDGEQWFLKFYVRLAIAQREGKQILWLFDEPGHFLHTTSQVDLKSFFETISEKAQVIYTSHLAMMVPWHRLERIFAVENTAKEGTVVHKRFWKDSQLDSPLKEALSTFVGEELLGGKEHLIVEGVSDYFFLQGWVRYFQQQTPVKSWAKSYTLNKRILVPVDGIEKIPLYCWFLGRKVKKGINWVVIVDSAAESTATSKKMTDAGLGNWAKNIQSIGSIAGIKKPLIEEIEGVFAPEEYLRLCRAYYSEEYPSCVLPTDVEVLTKHATGEEPKLTKTIEALILAKNPTGKTQEGKPFALDKTGIAQHGYKLLSCNDASMFSEETQTRFAKVFDNIEKTFGNEIETEEEA